MLDISLYTEVSMYPKLSIKNNFHPTGSFYQWMSCFITELVAFSTMTLAVSRVLAGRQATAPPGVTPSLSHGKRKVSASWKSGSLHGVWYLSVLWCLNDCLIKLTRSFCLRATPSPWKICSHDTKAGRKPQQMLAVVYRGHHITSIWPPLQGFSLLFQNYHLFAEWAKIAADV